MNLNRFDSVLFCFGKKISVLILGCLVLHRYANFLTSVYSTTQLGKINRKGKSSTTNSKCLDSDCQNVCANNVKESSKDCYPGIICNSRVSCQKGPTRHAYAWQKGAFWQDTLELWISRLMKLHMIGANPAKVVWGYDSWQSLTAGNYEDYRYHLSCLV